MNARILRYHTFKIDKQKMFETEVKAHGRKYFISVEIEDNDEAKFSDSNWWSYRKPYEKADRINGTDEIYSLSNKEFKEILGEIIMFWNRNRFTNTGWEKLTA